MKNSVFMLALLLLVFSHNINSQWEQTSNGMYNLQVYSLAANSSKIFAGTSQALSVSADNGANWYLTSFNSQIEPVHSLFVYYDNVYAGVQGYGLTVSSDNGGYWTFHHPVGNRTIYSVTRSNGYVFAGASIMNPGTGPAAVHVSTDNGYSFTQTSLINKTVLSLTSNGNTIFAGTLNEGIYVSTNNGVNWLQTSLNNHTIKSLASNGNFIIAGTGSGVYISSNNGGTWIQTSLNSGDVLSLAVSGNSVFAGLSNATNFYVSSNNGTAWTLKNEGLGSNTINALCIKDNFIFAGTSNNGVYRRLLSDLVGIQPVSNGIPHHYSLSQNYPNPFNPATKIKFAIPVGNGRDRSMIKIYDALGREISTLVDEELNAGIYEVDWNAANYPSGVYFYKLTSKNYTETKKMILIK